MSFRPLDIVLGVLTLLAPITIHLFFPVIPAVKNDFGLSITAAQLTFSAGVFALACSTLFYGALADRYGRRPVLFIGLTLFLIGSVMSAAATSFGSLLAGRLLQAIGGGSGITLARAIARDVYGADRLVKSIAFLTLCFALGGLTCPALGGLLVDVVGWRATFILASLVGLAALAGSYVMIPETAPKSAIENSGSPLTSLWELLGHRRFCALVIHTGCSTGAFMTLATAASVLMKELLNRPASEFGLYFAMVPLGYVAGTLISSRIGNRASIEQMLLIASALSISAVFVQGSLLLLGYISPLVLFLPGSFLTLAQGLSLPFAQTGAMQTVPRLAATAGGVGVFVQNLMGAGVAQIYGIFADGTPVPLVVTTGIMAAFSLAAALVVAQTSRRDL